jgi:DNA-binding transcriptional regulator/RsmH inhibitor MraZ
MHFVAEAVPGEITLMFVSYLLFCTVLMYLFVKTDREWGRLEVSLDSVPRRNAEAATVSAMLFSGADIAPEPMFSDAAVRQSLRHCTEHHPLQCACFLQELRDEQV